MDFITQGEKDKIQTRLSSLRTNRKVLSTRIAEARAHGDLSENGEYHAAREQQGLEEAEIRRLEDRLQSAQIVSEDAMGTGVVFLGSTVKIKEVEKGRVDTVKLVGEVSAEPPEDYDEVSSNSPMGEALMKARVGETIRVNTPRGVKRFEIVEIV